MKKIKLFIAFISFALFTSACETEMVDRLDEFGLEQGGYLRQVSPFPLAPFTIKLSDMTGTKMEFLAEAVTPDFGSLFQSYDLTVRFVDATAANGSNSKPYIALKSIASSSFVKDAVTGYPRATITVTGKEVAEKLGLTAAEMASGDRFEISGTMVLTNGKSYNAANTGLNITGGAFYSSPFFYRLNIVD